MYPSYPEKLVFPFDFIDSASPFSSSLAEKSFDSKRFPLKKRLVFLPSIFLCSKSNKISPPLEGLNSYSACSLESLKTPFLPPFAEIKFAYTIFPLSSSLNFPFFTPVNFFHQLLNHFLL